MYLTTEETKLSNKFKKEKDIILKPICVILSKLKITPIILSWLGLFFMGVFLYFILGDSYIAWFFLLISLFFDNLDGSLARYQNIDAESGFWIDILIDNFGFFIALSFLIWYGKIIHFWGIAYFINYIFMFGISIYGLVNEKIIVPVFRTKYYVFIFYFIDFIWSTNILNPFLVLLSIYMLVMNISNVLLLINNGRFRKNII